MTRKTKKPEKKLLKIDIACGQSKRDGFYGVDIAKLPGVDLVHDLEKFPWPFKDNSASELNCSHYIEHTKDLIAFMDECYRILVVGGTMTVYAPYYSSMRAWQDPTHRRAIAETTFLYYNKQWREQNKLDHYGIKCDFDFTYGYLLSPEWVSRSEESKQFAIRNYINAVSDITVTLTKRG